MTGTKLEALHRRGVGNADRYRVGRVLTRDQHPNADRLRVCHVDAGTGESLQIDSVSGDVVVAGAPSNVFATEDRQRIALAGDKTTYNAVEEVSFEIGRGEIVPYYQPIVELTTGHLVGFEAQREVNDLRRVPHLKIKFRNNIGA